MRKVFYISILLMGFLSAAQAQKKIIYQDTSLLQKDESIDVPINDEEINTTTKTEQEDADSTVFSDTFVSKVDTSLYLNGIQFDGDSIKNWKRLREYAYAKYLDSLLRNKKAEKQPEYKPNPPSGPGVFSGILSSGITKVILFTLAIAFVLFVIYRLFISEGVFKRKTKAVENATEQQEEEIITKESDFDRLIRVALQNGNYRQAVRYQYLRTLNKLADKSFVELAPDKTNLQYVREMQNTAYQNEFAALTLNYEYVWYGEFNIDQPVYQKIENGFVTLNQKL